MLSRIKKHPYTSLTGILTGAAWLATQPPFEILPASWSQKIMMLGIVLTGLFSHDAKKNDDGGLRVRPRFDNSASRLLLVLLISLLFLPGCGKPSASIPKAPATKQDVAKSGVVAAGNVYSGLTLAVDLVEQLNKGVPQVLSDAEALRAYKILRQAGLHTKDFKNAAIRFGTIDSTSAPKLDDYIKSALDTLRDLQSLNFKDAQKRQDFLAFIETARQGYDLYRDVLKLFGKSSLTTDELGIPQLQKLDAALPNQI